MKSNKLVLLAALATLVVGLGVGALVAVALTADDAEPPTSISTSDLQRDGEFWKSLTPDLKDELVRIAKREAAAVNPTNAERFLSGDTARIVVEMDEEYTNQAKLDVSISETFKAAYNELQLEHRLEGQ